MNFSRGAVHRWRWPSGPIILPTYFGVLDNYSFRETPHSLLTPRSTAHGNCRFYTVPSNNTSVCVPSSRHINRHHRFNAIFGRVVRVVFFNILPRGTREPFFPTTCTLFFAALCQGGAHKNVETKVAKVGQISVQPKDTHEVVVVHVTQQEIPRPPVCDANSHGTTASVMWSSVWSMLMAPCSAPRSTLGASNAWHSRIQSPTLSFTAGRALSDQSEFPFVKNPREVRRARGSRCFQDLDSHVSVASQNLEFNRGAPVANVFRHLKTHARACPLR